MARASRLVSVATFMAVALAEGVFAAPVADAAEARLQITYPLDGTLFPPESVAPTFVWEDRTEGVVGWEVVVRDDAGREVLRASVAAPRWLPSEENWKQIKE